MGKINFTDDLFAIVAFDESEKYGKFTRYIPSDGKFVMVLPYRKKRGEWEYLLAKENISAWDSNPDHAGLSLELKYQPEVSCAHLIKMCTGLEIKHKEFLHLGVVCGSKYSADMTYLFAIDLSEYPDFSPNGASWEPIQSLVGSVDALLLSAYTRLVKFTS